MTKHKHHDVIVAWANGETIEWSFEGQEWKPLNNNEPRFNEMLHYRVKPAEPVRKYPETTMTDAELIATIKERLNPMKNLRDCVNAALRHAIDSGQVVAIQPRSSEEAAMIQPLLDLIKHGPESSEMSFFGVPLTDLTAEELRSLFAWHWKELSEQKRTRLEASIRGMNELAARN